MKIIHGEREQISAILPLLEELFSIEEDFTFDAAKARAAAEMLLGRERAVLLLAMEDHVVCGMVSGQLLISTAEGGYSLLVEDLVVKQEYRGRGFATELLRAVTTWAEEKGATRAQLLADRNNATALAFYAGRGWRKTQLICLRESRD